MNQPAKQATASAQDKSQEQRDKTSKQPLVFLTRKELAERHRVSIESLKRLERAGRIRYLKLGRGVRYRISDVIAYEQASEVAA
jgi:hypothetical protein